jgi:hypothetical protein
VFFKYEYIHRMDWGRLSLGTFETTAVMALMGAQIGAEEGT